MFISIIIKLLIALILRFSSVQNNFYTSKFKYLIKNLVLLEIKAVYNISKLFHLLLLRFTNSKIVLVNLFINLYTFWVLNIKLRLILYYLVGILFYNVGILSLNIVSDLLLYILPVLHAEGTAIPLSTSPELQKDFLFLFKGLKDSGLTEIQAKDFILKLNQKYRSFYLLLENSRFISRSELLKFRNDIYLLVGPYSKVFSTEKLNSMLFDCTLWFEKVYNIPSKYCYFSEVGIPERQCMFQLVNSHCILIQYSTFRLLFQTFRNELLYLGVDEVLAYRIERDLEALLDSFIIKIKHASFSDKDVLYADFMNSVGSYLTDITKNHKFDNFQRFALGVHIKSVYLIFLDISYMFDFSSLISNIYCDGFYTCRMYKELESLFFSKHCLVAKNAWTAQDEQDLLITIKKVYFYNASADTRRSDDLYAEFEKKVIKFFNDYYNGKDAPYWKFSFFKIDKKHYAYKLFYKRVYA